MNTLFECWNAGVIEWDGMTTPVLSFSYPVSSNEMLAFFLISARLNQLLTKQDWQLSFAGVAYSVPPFPSYEMCRLLGQIPVLFGYGPRLLLVNALGKNTDESPLSHLHWVHLASGDIVRYAPFIGARRQHHRQPKANGLVVASCDEMQVHFRRDGRLTGIGDLAMIERLELCHHRSFQTAYMLQQYFKSARNSKLVWS